MFKISRFSILFLQFCLPSTLLSSVKNAYKATIKILTFLEGHKILRNLYRRIDCYYMGQIYGGDIVEICGFLRIYEFYLPKC